MWIVPDVEPKLTELPIWSMVPPSRPPIISSPPVRFDVYRPHRDLWFGTGLWLMVWACAMCVVCGCQFFAQKTVDKATSPSQRMLSPLKPAQDAIQFDVLILDRRADDPLLGPQLWDQMDQVGAVGIETGDLLKRNGFLIGRAAAKPPTPMLKLLGLASEIEGLPIAADRDAKTRIPGRTYTVRSGTESEIQISDVLPEAEATIFDPGETRVVNHQLTRFVFRMKPIRLQDGWVRMDFLPEIHHGDLQLRPTPSEELGWTYKTTQNVMACHPQKFSVTLNVGESAVISSAADAEGSLGANFFRRDQQGEMRQRLLVVRLANMGRTGHATD